MVKKYLLSLAALFGLLMLNTVGHATAFFDVSASGLTLNINTTTTFYPNAGIKINTPGYTLNPAGSGCTVDNTSGYCLFPVGKASNQTAQISLTGPSGNVSFTLTPYGKHCVPKTTQNYSANVTAGFSITIDTVPSWNGTSFISPWGVPNTATYGQIITAPTSATSIYLTDFTFYLLTAVATPAPQFQAFVYEWDAVNRYITGPALYTSTVMTAPTSATFVPVTIQTGMTQLTPGTQYVLFFTTSSVTQSGNSAYRWGKTTGTVYPSGSWAWDNNGSNFSQLSTQSWDNSSPDSDLAFTANFIGIN